VTRRRVLILAEAANPQMTSVPLEGWSLARAIADICDVHLVTQIRNREAIEATGWNDGLQFTAIDSERVARPINRLEGLLRGGTGKGWTTVMALRWLPYLYFEHLAWQHFKKDLRSGRFDLVHRITPISPTLPSPIASKLARIGVPFVIGPLNGGLPWPKEFSTTRHAEREWLSHIRNAFRFLPGYRATRKNASAILIGSHATWDQMPARYHQKCVYVAENAIDPARFSMQSTRQATRPLRCIFVGRLVPYKGPDMLLEAAKPLLKSGEITLSMLGDGPLLSTLRQQVETEEIPGVDLPGWIPHEQLQHRLAESDLFVFPSIREFGGAVVLEAMAMGCVPIVVDYGGPGELVTESTGVKLPLGSRTQIVERLREAISDKVADPSRIDRLRAAARQRVFDQFTWPIKANQVVKVYESILNKVEVTSLKKPSEIGGKNSEATRIYP
jgi:glycosyltransferase involved in cell wall biosynthesis